MAKGLAAAVRQLVEDRGIPEELVMGTIEEFLRAAYKRHFGDDENAVVRFDEDGEEVTLYAKKRIVAEVEDPVEEIPLDQARKYADDCEVGDELLIEIDPGEFDRVSIQSAKQKARERLRDIQKDTLYSEFKQKEGEMVIGYVQRERNDDIYVELGRAEGLLPRRYQSSREVYRRGDRIKALVYEVTKRTNGVSIILSRTHTDFVQRIFEVEVPEIYDRTVEIHKIVREPGYRTKIAVYSNREDVDPVGACVGMKGVRIQSIVRELEGEKIDIVEYRPDPREFIRRALSPAQVSQVVLLDEAKRHALAVVPEDQLSLAIGREGRNVRLANRLVDWSIDVKTAEQAESLDLGLAARRDFTALFEEAPDETEEISTVAELPGIPASLVKKLERAEIVLIEDLVALTDDEIVGLEELSSDEISRLRQIIAENVEIIEEDSDGDTSDGDQGDEADQEQGFDEDADAEGAWEESDDYYDGNEDAVDADDSAPEDDSYEEEITAVSELPGIPDVVVRILEENGIHEIVDLLSMPISELKGLDGMTKEYVEAIETIISDLVIEEDDESEEE